MSVIGSFVIVNHLHTEYSCIGVFVRDNNDSVNIYWSDLNHISHAIPKVIVASYVSTNYWKIVK